jgi:hypothetical protein
VADGCLCAVPSLHMCFFLIMFVADHCCPAAAVYVVLSMCGSWLDPVLAKMAPHLTKAQIETAVVSACIA